MQDFNAFTKREKGLARVLNTKVAIIIDEKINPEYVKTNETYEAIWDTGATNTVISEKLAHKLKLTPNGTANVYTAGGVIEVNRYILGLKLPNNLIIKNVYVTAGKLSDNTDFLIGMDIIALGDFSVTNVDGKTTFSFRTPSCKTIDYVKEARELQRKDLLKEFKRIEKEINSGGKCSCGSGRKFRYCHGKEQLKKVKEELEKLKV